MPNLLQFDPAQFVGFFLIFSRISGVMISAPILGDSNIPPFIKVLLTFIISLVFYPVVAAPNLGANPGTAQLLLTTLSEVGIGLLMGYTVRLMFTGIGLAGEVIGFQMGIGMANIFDPTSQTQTSLVGQIQTIFALLLFITLDGHLLFIRSLAGSYQIIQAGGLVMTEGATKFYTAQLGQIFLVGMQLGAPLIVSLMVANLGMGLITRAVPQLNVIIVGIPFTIALGLIFLSAGFPFFIHALILMNEKLESLLMMALRVMR